MIIAFEGPDKTGKSTSAARSGDCRYNAVKDHYDAEVATHSHTKGIVTAYDRIDWLTHMIYRLALPEYEWEDGRVRTVFAAPEMHLVFKLHLPGYEIGDELYNLEQSRRVNSMYHYFAGSLIKINENFGFSLFKTISIVYVKPASGYKIRLSSFSSPVTSLSTLEMDAVSTDEDLMHILLQEEQARA